MLYYSFFGLRSLVFSSFSSKFEMFSLSPGSVYLRNIYQNVICSFLTLAFFSNP